MWIGTGLDSQYYPQSEVAARALGPQGLGFVNSIVVMSLGRDDGTDVDDLGIQRDVWNVADRSIAAIIASGMTVTLKVMQWMPPQASDGKPAFLRNEYGPWVNHGSWPKNGGWHVYGECADAPPKKLCPSCQAAPDRVAWMNNPPKISGAWWHDAGRRVANRYADVLGGSGRPMEIAIINEWGETLFSPWIRLANLGRISRADAFLPYETIRSNFMAGVWSIAPEARVDGPEAAYFGDLEQALMDEAESGGTHFHTASVHPYAPAGTFPDGVYNRMDNEFLATLTKYFGPRAFDRMARITEVDDGGSTGDPRKPDVSKADGVRLVNFLREFRKRYGAIIDGMNLGGLESRLFTEWPPKTAAPQLTPMGQELRSYLTELANEVPDVSEDIARIRAAVDSIERRVQRREP